jgi:hypothetical protein
MESILGKITVESVTENPDGTATIVFNIPEKTKQNIKKTMNWNRWSAKKFNELVTEALMKMYNNPMEKLNGESTRQTNSNFIDPFDNNISDLDKNNG